MAFGRWKRQRRSPEEASGGLFSGHRPPHFASTFPDQDMAEQVLEALITEHADAVATWLGGSDDRIVLRDSCDVVVGRSASRRTREVVDVRGVHAVLVRDNAMPDGWRAHTAYPIPDPIPTELETPALANLMGGHFHQDWESDYHDQAEAVDAFVAGSPSMLAPIGAEIEQLLARYGEEHELEAHLIALGCEFTVHEPTETYRAWLTEIARRLREAGTG